MTLIPAAEIGCVVMVHAASVITEHNALRIVVPIIICLSPGEVCGPTIAR
jgi:hypothetical protein